MPVINDAANLMVGDRQALIAVHQGQIVWPSLGDEPPGVPTAVAVVRTAVEGELELTFAAPADGGPVDNYVVQALDGSWVTVASPVTPAASLHTWTFVAGIEDDIQQMRVRASGPGGESDYVIGGVVPGWRPTVPTNVGAAATAVVNELSLTWGAPSVPGVGTIAYQAQADDGGFTNIGTTSPSNHTWSSGGSKNMRVNASNDYGTSAWAQVSGTPLADTTPPPVPVITSWKPEDSFGRMVVRFDISSSADNHEYRIEWMVNDGPQSNFGWQSAAPNASVVKHVITAPNAAGNKHDIRVRVRDSAFNEAVTDWETYTVQVTPIYVSPDSTGHYRQGAYGQDVANPNRIYQGYHSDPNFVYFGYLWYGTKIDDQTDAITSIHNNVDITSMRLLLIRDGGGNNQPDCVYVGTHNMAANPGNVVQPAEPLNEIQCLGTLTYGQSNWFTLPSGWATSLSRGEQLGVGLNASPFGGKPYLYLWPQSGNEFQGVIEVNHLG